jgi:hypothetical protein
MIRDLEAVWVLRKHGSDEFNFELPSEKQADAICMLLNLLVEQHDELAALRAENARLRSAAEA